jgi:hypothetical protein
VATINRYVNASTGNNSNDGLTAGTPWLTIQHGLTNMPAGATADYRVLHLAGTFTLASSLTFDAGIVPLILNSTYSRDSNGYLTCGATIDISALTALSSTNRAYQHVNGIQIIGITPAGYGGGPINIASAGHWTNCVFRQKTATTSGYAWRSTATIPTLISCELYGLAGTSNHPFCSAMNGYYIDCLFDAWRVGYGGVYASRCRIRNCAQWAIYIEAPSSVGALAACVDHCSIWNCGNQPLGGSQYIEDRYTNNIFARASGSGSLAWMISRSGNTFSNNAIWNYVDTGSNDSDIPGRIFNYSASTILSASPFAVDPATTNIWTPTALIAALPSTDGTTIGAVQAASSGGGLAVARGMTGGMG